MCIRMSEAADFVSGEVVTVKHVLISLGKCILVALIEVKCFIIVSKQLTASWCFNVVSVAGTLSVIWFYS
jgi:hypothetical protein